MSRSDSLCLSDVLRQNPEEEEEEEEESEVESEEESVDEVVSVPSSFIEIFMYRLWNFFDLAACNRPLTQISTYELASLLFHVPLTIYLHLFRAEKEGYTRSDPNR